MYKNLNKFFETLVSKATDYFTDPKYFIGLILMLTAWGGIVWMDWRREKEIWEGIKGEDGVLQIPEYIIRIWIKLYPPVILADLFLDFDLSANGWWSMNIIMLLALVGKVAVMQFLRISTEKVVHTVREETSVKHSTESKEKEDVAINKEEP